jgi:hypothetical protein
MRRSAPYGSWSSPLTAERIARGALGLSMPRLDGASWFWLEGRPGEAGRQTVVRWRDGVGAEEVTPPGLNVRSRVHEYGGGDYAVRDGLLVHVDAASPGIRVVDLEKRTTEAAASP